MSVGGWLGASYPLPERIGACECGEAATYLLDGVFAGRRFLCDSCATVAAAEQWAGINEAVQSMGYEIVRNAEGYAIQHRSGGDAR